MICTLMLIASTIEEAEELKKGALKMWPHLRYQARQKIQDLASDLLHFGSSNGHYHMVDGPYLHLVSIQDAIRRTEKAERMRGR